MEIDEFILDRFWEIDLPDADETGGAMENELERIYLVPVTNDFTKVNGIDTWDFDNIPYLYSACL
jgi:hypothetical protein